MGLGQEKQLPNTQYVNELCRPSLLPNRITQISLRLGTEAATQVGEAAVHLLSQPGHRHRASASLHSGCLPVSKEHYSLPQDDRQAPGGSRAPGPRGRQEQPMATRKAKSTTDGQRIVRGRATLGPGGEEPRRGHHEAEAAGGDEQGRIATVTRQWRSYPGGRWRAVSWTRGRLSSPSSRCRPCGSGPGSGVPGAGHCGRTRQVRGPDWTQPLGETQVTGSKASLPGLAEGRPGSHWLSAEDSSLPAAMPAAHPRGPCTREKGPHKWSRSGPPTSASASAGVGFPGGRASTQKTGSESWGGPGVGRGQRALGRDPGASLRRSAWEPEGREPRHLPCQAQQWPFNSIMRLHLFLPKTLQWSPLHSE